MFVRTGHRGQVSPDRPLLISITSETDDATKGWFPIGTSLPNIFAHRRYKWDEKYNKLSSNVDQHDYLTSTPGHNRRLATHQVLPVDATLTIQNSRIGPCADSNRAFEENLQRPRGNVFATGDQTNPETLYWWRLNKTGPNPASPYWIIRVPPQIIHKHSPIFTPQGRAMMAALFRMTNPKSEPGPRKMTWATRPE